MDLIIIGAGGYGNTILDLALQSKDFENIYFLDDQKTGKHVVGKTKDFIKFISDNVVFYPAIGNNTIRLNWINILKENNTKILTLIHSTAYVSRFCKIGDGTIVLPGAIINTNTLIDEGCIINCGAIIDHDCIIEKGVHICLGAIVKAENRISSGTKIEAGEIVQFRSFSR